MRRLLSAKDVRMRQVVHMFWVAKGLMDRRALCGVAALVMVGLSAGPVAAQGFEPPGRIASPPGAVGGQPGVSADASPHVRIDRLENRIRELTGQIEQLEFQMRAMRRLLEGREEGMDLRLRGDTGSSPASDREAGAGQAPAPDARNAEPPALERRQRRGDAFDPQSNRDAPGAPRQLGQITMPPETPPSPTRPSGAGDEPIDLLRPGAGAPGERKPDGAGAAAPQSLPENPRDLLRTTRAALEARRYADAETGFKTFIERFPDSPLAADAEYGLGETYWRSGRHREAAEQFLKVSTDYEKSPRAPASLLQLGLALEKLGAQEQACASYAEFVRRYPKADKDLDAQVRRQKQRAKC